MPVRTVRNNSPRQRAGRTFPYEPPGTGRARAATVRFVCRRSQKVIPNWPLRGQITVVLTVCLSLTGVYFSLSAHAAGHQFLRTPYAGGAPSFLRDQEPSNAARAEAACGLCLASARNRRRNRMPSCLHGRLRCQEEADRQHVGQRKQRSHREYDSPFLPPVGPENCTFPGRQPLPRTSV